MIQSFDSPEALRARREQVLEQMLAGFPELGVFLLVLANACYDQRLWQRLSEPLRQRYREHDAALAQGGGGLVLDDTDDDLQVFRALQRIGFEQLAPVEFRDCGPWELQFNPLRALRPPRMTGEAIDGLYHPFSNDGFHFNRPFLRKEIIWRGSLCERPAVLLFNKYPFVDLHGLLVPEVRAGLPQFLTREQNDWIWQVTESLAGQLPGIGFGYNSLGACASVNHLHFQFFCRGQPLPVANPLWRHNGGDRTYPLDCRVVDSPDVAWQVIEALHADRLSYNLLYLPGRCYCLPRRSQGSYRQCGWGGEPAWFELAGGFTSFSRERFEQLQPTDLEQTLAALALGSPAAARDG